jgi:succinate-semialdehyde dehydrogenase/glutarate-semialdehyde dehydrogenase
MKIVSINPSNNEEVGAIEETTKEEVIKKVNLAKSVKNKWARLEIEERIVVLKEICNKFEENSDKIANLISLEMGKPINQSENEIKSTLKTMKWDLENAANCIAPETTFESDNEIQKVFYEPKGIVVAISPFNYPFSLCCATAFQNLIVGNLVISKPDPNVPLLYKFLEEILDNSNLPSGVWQFVFGGKEIGSYLVEQDIDMICFTGNTKTGEYLYKVAASKMIPILMELGGSAPGIVCEDADINCVIDGIFKKKFSNSGQLCHALKRLIVHENVFGEVVNKLKSIAEKQNIGEPLDRNTTIGPLVNEKQINTLLEQFNDAKSKGANIICGGKQLKGNYFEPTILTNITKDMKVWEEEVFGPILPIVTFKTIEEAIELANDTIYGLGGYVFTTNRENFEKISRELKTGMVALNNLAYSAPYNPFGGVKKSGLGRTRGKWGLRGLCNIKVVTFENNM